MMQMAEAWRPLMHLSDAESLLCSGSGTGLVEARPAKASGKLVTWETIRFSREVRGR